MTEFNQHPPLTLGVEWMARFKAAQPINSPSNAGAVRFTAESDWEAQRVWCYFTNLTDAQQGQGSGWEMEFYRTDNLGDTQSTVSIYRPIQDVRKVGPLAGYSVAEAPDTFLTNLYRAIDSTTLVPGIWPNTGAPIDNNELMFPFLVPGIADNGYEYTARFDGLEGGLDDKRITRVSIVARVQEYVGSEFVAGMTITPYLLIHGIRFLGTTQVFNGETPGGHEVRGDWTFNPRNRASWKVSDVRQFDPSAPTGGIDPPFLYSAGWIVNGTGTANNIATILQGWLEVETTNDTVDPRLATAVFTAPTPGWNQSRIGIIHNSITTPPTGLVLENGVEYLAVLRQRCGGARLSWRYLDAGDGLEQIHPAGTDSPLCSFTDDTFVLSGIAEEQSRVFTFALNEGLGTDWHPDGAQPYAHCNDDVERNLSINYPWTRVNSDQFMEQSLRGDHATADYAWVRALVCFEDGRPDADLVFTVRTAIGAQVGGTFTVTPDDLDEPTDAFQIVEGALDAPASLSVADLFYGLRAESDATPGSGWRVQMLSTQLVGTTGGPPAELDSLTYGGNADATAASIDELAHGELDAVMSIATRPAAPTDFTAQAVEVTPCIDVVELAWTPAVLNEGEDFLRYEIERSDDRTDWRRIAAPTDGDVVAFTDQEARSNTTSSYRIRTRRADYSASEWTEVATAEPLQACCGYVLSSNANQDLIMFAVDIGNRETGYPEDSTFLSFEGRPNQVGFFGLDDRGAQFTRTLALAGEGFVDDELSPTTTPGERTYDAFLAFRASRRAGVPYVCVKNDDGDRWFAGMVLQDGGAKRSEPDGTYTVSVEFREVTTKPYPVDVTP